MMTKSIAFIRFASISFFVLFVTILSCKKPSDPVEKKTSIMDSLTPYSILYPAHFPVMDILDDNKPYVERIALGRMLYYDPILSNNGKSCSSCHLQSKGFTVDVADNQMPVLSHVNLAWNKQFMWDGSKRGSLEDVMIFETKEFFATDLNKINSSSKYKKLFKETFGVDNITHKEIGYALAQFTRTMISRDCKYDKYVKGTAQLTYDEEQGRQIFFSEKGDCFHCHTNVVTTDNQMHNTGLDSIYKKEADKGYFNVTGNPNDKGKFKTPNLRNVELRTHFMHDGRFKTLEEVVDFYNNDVYIVSNVDPIMTKTGKENGLNLTKIEQKQLVAFLKTFTDQTFLTDTNFSNPN